MAEYGKLNIPKELLIVESPIYEMVDGKWEVKAGVSAGRPVAKGNKKMLENAIADSFIYDEAVKGWVRGGSSVHEYANGTFTAMIRTSPDTRPRGGKYADWGCTVTDENGKAYRMSINAENLLEALLCNTFVNGVCQSKVYLGRKAGQAGIFTESMPSFKQAMEDEALRNRKQSDKYGAWQVVYTKVDGREVYLGPVYEKILIYARRCYSFHPTVYVTAPKKPEVRHAYAPLSKQEGQSEKLGHPKIYSSKRKLYSDEGDSVVPEADNAYDGYMKLEAWKEGSKHRGPEYALNKLRYGSDDSPLELTDEIKESVKACLNDEGWRGEIRFVSEEEYRKIEKENGKNEF